MVHTPVIPARDVLVSSVAADWPGLTDLPGRTCLILGDGADALFSRLGASGKQVVRWHRHCYPDQDTGAWPPKGRFDQIWLRIPRSAREIQMLLAAAAARVTPGGLVAVYGAKDEGIRSVDKHRPDSIGVFETQWVKRRCRVLVARAGSSMPADAPDDALETWRSGSTIDWGEGPRRWAFYPGMFAHGRLDPATRLLIDHLPPVPKDARILDYGAGSGIIGAALMDREPTCTVDLLDVDAVALAASAINVPAAGRIHAADLSTATGTYDLVISNPPIHEGKTETLRIVRHLAQEATRVLSPRGSLTLVVQRRLGAESLLKASFRTVRIVADEGPFRVLSGRP